MLKRLFALTLLAMMFILSGCATRADMAFSKHAKHQTIGDEPIYLMTVSIKNDYHTSFKPELLVINVERDVAVDKVDRIIFWMDDQAVISESDSDQVPNEYCLRMELAQGKYVIRGLTSQKMIFPINGFFFAPLHADLEAKGPGVYYLGHVNAFVRERTGEEFRAGPILPLIDQAVAGASGGTFDIEISDKWASDEALFRSKFPQLSKVEIKKAILPPLDRDKAQKWWADH